MKNFQKNQKNQKNQKKPEKNEEKNEEKKNQKMKKRAQMFFLRRCIPESEQIILPIYRRKNSTKTSAAPKRTHSYVHGASSVPLLSKTIGQLVDEQADAFPDKELFVLRHQNVRKTFSDLKRDVDKFASGLFRLGLTRGDRVGIWGPNSYEWLVTQYATAKAGFILVNVNPAYKAHELEYCLNKVQIKALVTAEGLKSTLYYPILEELNPGLRAGKKTDRYQTGTFSTHFCSSIAQEKNKTC